MRALSFSFILIIAAALTGCSAGGGQDSNEPVWVKVDALFPSEVAGKKRDVYEGSYKQLVDFHNETGEIIGGIGLADSPGMPSSYDGWSSGLFYDPEPLILYGAGISKVERVFDEVKSLGRKNIGEVNGFKVYSGISGSKTKIHFAVLEDTFYIFLRWNEDEDYDDFFRELLQSLNIGKLRELVIQ